MNLSLKGSDGAAKWKSRDRHASNAPGWWVSLNLRSPGMDYGEKYPTNARGGGGGGGGGMGTSEIDMAK